MKGKKVLLTGKVASKNKHEKDAEVFIKVKFEVGENSQCSILPEGNKKILVVTNLPKSLVITAE